MAVNTDDAGKSQVRQTLLKITNEGAEFINPISATIRHNRYAQANTFTVKICLYGDKEHDFAWWGDLARVDFFQMEITFGVNGITQKMMTGLVDKIHVDTKKGIVTCHGRDNWAVLIETFSLQSFGDKTVNDVMQSICDNHGFTFITKQKNNPEASQLQRETGWVTAGGQHTQLVNEANLVDFLANRSNSFAYFDGDTLSLRDHDDIDGLWEVRFEPPNNDGKVIILNPSNAINVVFERDINIARNTSVQVNSYDADTGNKEPLVGYDSQSKRRPGITGYTVHKVRPGLKTQEQLDNMANSIYDKMIRHEKKCHWEEPGSLDLTCLFKMVLIGGNTDWHQVYWIESIERTMDWHGGFIMECIGSAVDPALANDETF